MRGAAWCGLEWGKRSVREPLGTPQHVVVKLLLYSIKLYQLLSRFLACFTLLIFAYSLELLYLALDIHWFNI